MRRTGPAALLVLAAGALLAGCGDDGPGSAQATRAMVLETCAPGGDPVETRVCECAYEALAERFAGTELERIDRQLRDDPEAVPPEVQEAVLGCTFELVSPPTTKPVSTTTTTPSTTSTTVSEP